MKQGDIVPKRSAGLLLYRRDERGLEVLLVHPGGPFWANKDLGSWTIPKGEYAPGEEPLHAARREFQEETGMAVDGDFLPLGVIRQAAGKLVSAWAHQGDLDPARLTSNLCSIEWPLHSGRTIEIPEVDRGAWFTIPEARRRILKSQQPVLDSFLLALDSVPPDRKPSVRDSPDRSSIDSGSIDSGPIDPGPIDPDSIDSGPIEPDPAERGI